MTGAAGFIGMHTARAPARAQAHTSTGVDNFDPYYDVALKEARVAAVCASALRLPRISTSPTPKPHCAAVSRRTRSRTWSILRRTTAACDTRWREPRRCTCATTSCAFGHVLEGCRHATGRASRLCIVVVACTARTTRCRSPRTSRSIIRSEPVRGDEEGERADGAQLQPPLSPAGDGAALLHRLRPVGRPRHRRR